MSRTITNAGTVGIKLTRPSDNPVTVADVAAIRTTGLYAIYGSEAAPWTITNHGRLSAAHYGVTLAAGGSVTNGDAGFVTASISGGTVGIVIAGDPGTVSNYGTVTSSSAYLLGTKSSYYKTGFLRFWRRRDTRRHGHEWKRRRVDCPHLRRQIRRLHRRAIRNRGQQLYDFQHQRSTLTIVLQSLITTLRPPTAWPWRSTSGGLVVNGAIDNTGALITGGKAGIAISGSTGNVVNDGTSDRGSTTYNSGFSLGGSSVGFNSGYGTGVSAVRGRLGHQWSCRYLTSSVIDGGRYGVVISGQSGVVTNDGTIAGVQQLH